MSSETQELLNICEQLPQAKRAEVADFARFLLAANHNATPLQTTERWLATVRGAAKPGMTTDDVMAMTRGEPGEP